jgi:site-specific recombinase XerD
MNKRPVPVPGQRYVPIAAKHLQYIKDYLQEGREWFLHEHYTTAKWFTMQVNKKDDADGAAFLYHRKVTV